LKKSTQNKSTDRKTNKNIKTEKMKKSKRNLKAEKPEKI